MRYRAIGKLSCSNCRNVWLIDTAVDEPGFIEAGSEAAAAEKFRLIYRLCPACLQVGTPVAVNFDSYIRVEPLRER